MELHKERCRYLMDDGTQCLNIKEEGSNFCEQHANWLVADLAVYKTVTTHYQQDLREFWVRSNFYLLVQSGLISVFVAASGTSFRQGKATLGMLSVLGFIIAAIWFVVAKGAVIWIRRWRDQVIEIDNIIDRHRVYSRVESYVYSTPLMSPSNVTQYLPLVFCIAWFVAMGSLW